MIGDNLKNQVISICLVDKNKEYWLSKESENLLVLIENIVIKSTIKDFLEIY